MDKRLHNIDDSFYNALEGNEELPSSNVWAAIDARLDKDKVVTIRRKYMRVKMVAAVLLVSLSMLALYQINIKLKATSFAGKIIHKKENQASALPDKQYSKAIQADKDTIKVEKKTDVNKSMKAFAIDKIKKETLIGAIAIVGSKHLQQGTMQTSNNHDRQVGLAASSHSIRKKITLRHLYSIKITAGSIEEKIDAGNSVLEDGAVSIFDEAGSITSNKAGASLRKNNKEKKFIKEKLLKQNDSLTTAIASVKPIGLKDNLRHRFSLTPSFSPDFTWYNLQDEHNGRHRENAVDLEREEKHKFSYTAGILAGYTINKHWGFQGGINFSHTNITLEPKLIYAQPDNTGSVKYLINTSSGYGYILPSYSTSPIVGDSLYTSASLHSLQYIGIPIAVTYGVTYGRLSYSAMAGIALNFLTKAKLETTVSNGNNQSPETVDNLIGVKKLYLNGLAGAGIDYSLTGKLALAFSPTLRFAVSPINKDAAVRSYPMSFGLSLGLKVTL